MEDIIIDYDNTERSYFILQNKIIKITLEPEFFLEVIELIANLIVEKLGTLYVYIFSTEKIGIYY